MLLVFKVSRVIWQSVALPRSVTPLVGEMLLPLMRIRMGWQMPPIKVRLCLGHLDPIKYKLLWPA